MTFQAYAALLIGLAACFTDLRNRTIPNWIPAAALAGGVGWHATGAGWRGVALALGGAVCGFLAFLVFYLLGGMGGGDVKLTAGFGALLGLPALWQALLWICLAGGLAAAGVVYWRQLRKLWSPGGGGAAQEDFIPYAPAIAAGVWITLWVRT
jgi:prepilin peptidase CpaA